MSLTQQPYNLSLPSYSAVWIFLPWRDGDPTQGWNSSFTGQTHSVPDTVGTGVAYRTTLLDGATVTLEFEGTAIYLCLRSQFSEYTLFLDNQPIRTTATINNDPACAVYGGQANILAIATGLSYGPHNATLQGHLTTDNANLDFFGGTVTIGAGALGSKRIQVVDDSDPDFVYTSDWGEATDDTNMWNGNYHVSCDYSENSAAKYTFIGANAIMLHGSSLYNDYGYTVTLDNDPAYFNASDYYWRHSPVVLFFAGGLNNTQPHTITITNYDPNQPTPLKNNPYGNACASVDSISLVMDDPLGVSSPGLSPNATSNPSNSSNTTISVGSIAAIILAVLLVLLLILIAFLRWRLQKLSGKRADLNADDEASVLASVTQVTPWTSRGDMISKAPEDIGLLGEHSLTRTLETSHTPMPPPVRPRPREKRRDYRVQNTERGVELESILRGEGSSLQQSNAHEHATLTAQATIERTPDLPDQKFVENLARLLNGRLREEYLVRDGVSLPPDYSDEPQHS